MGWSRLPSAGVPRARACICPGACYRALREAPFGCCGNSADRETNTKSKGMRDEATTCSRRGCAGDAGPVCDAGSVARRWRRAISVPIRRRAGAAEISVTVTTSVPSSAGAAAEISATVTTSVPSSAGAAAEISATTTARSSAGAVAGLTTATRERQPAVTPPEATRRAAKPPAVTPRAATRPAAIPPPAVRRPRVATQPPEGVRPAVAAARGGGGVIGSTTGGSPGANTGGELPFTGLPIWFPMLLSAALLVSGGFLLRRRRGEAS